jgi:hypothetical protein
MQPVTEGTFWVKTTATRPKIMMTGDGRGRGRSRWCPTARQSRRYHWPDQRVRARVGQLAQRQRGHDPGRIAVDLAVMLVDGGEAIADLAVLRDQAGLFGPVASDSRAGIAREPDPTRRRG